MLDEDAAWKWRKEKKTSMPSTEPNTMAPQSTKLSQIADSGGLYHLACHCSDLRRQSCLYMEHRRSFSQSAHIYDWFHMDCIHCLFLGGSFSCSVQTGRNLLYLSWTGRLFLSAAAEKHAWLLILISLIFLYSIFIDSHDHFLNAEILGPVHGTV